LIDDTQLDIEKLLTFYECMTKIRRFEEKACELFTRGAISGWIHPSIGQEAVAVGVGLQLRKEDFIVITHRGHGHAIMKGISLKKLMAELFGKKTGICGGRGGSMHLFDKDLHIVSSSIVGAQIPLAVGLGLSVKYNHENRVIVSFFGDGATNTGAFHEGLNMAAIWKLPILFVCENNLYAISTHVSTATAVENIADRAAAYNIPSIIVDGNDVIEVYETTGKIIKQIREKDSGPYFMECKTYRWRGHAEGEMWELYRSKEEVERWMKKCPIERLRKKLLEKNPEISKVLRTIDEKISREIEDAVKFAEKSPFPSLTELTKEIYVEAQ